MSCLELMEHTIVRGYLSVCYVVGFVDDTDLQLVAFLFLDIFGVLDAKNTTSCIFFFCFQYCFIFTFNP